MQKPEKKEEAEKKKTIDRAAEKKSLRKAQTSFIFTRFFFVTVFFFLFLIHFSDLLFIIKMLAI